MIFGSLLASDPEFVRRGAAIARLDGVFTVMQSESMPNDAIVTVRIPAAVKRRLEQRARRGHRSLSAQVLHDLEQADVAAARREAPDKGGRFLGLYAGTPVASDDDIREVRARLWGRLARPVRG